MKVFIGCIPIIWFELADDIFLNIQRVLSFCLFQNVCVLTSVGNYLPQGLPRALLTRAAPANPAANPKAPLARVCPPNILLFVLLLPLVPPLVQGLNIWLAIYWVATPRAAPAAPASTALLPVKKQVRWAAGIIR